MICEFAETIRKQFRKGDVVGRIGGDEFAALMPFSEMDSLQKKVRKLSQSLDRDYECGGVRLHCSASIGVAVSPEEGEDFDTLYKNADVALYQTKKHGKNGYTIKGITQRGRK